jgi:hypothetical protein
MVDTPREIPFDLSRSAAVLVGTSLKTSVM